MAHLLLLVAAVAAQEGVEMSNLRGAKASQTASKHG